MKKLIATVMTVMLALTMTVTCFAAGAEVEFTGKKLITSGDYALDVAGLEPGDTTSVEITTKATGGAQAAWYVDASVLQSLEDMKKLSGGAYDYSLEYNGNPIVDSMVGGEHSTDGLHEASLDGFVYLGTMKKGDEGVLKLTVKYDGKTIKNQYMTTRSKISIDFAVEEKENHVSRIVKTGNEDKSWIWETAGVVAVIGIAAVLIEAKYDRKEKA